MREGTAQGFEAARSAEAPERAREAVPESEQEMKAELREMPQAERETLGVGLHNLGFAAEEWKNEKMGRAIEWGAGFVDGKGTVGRFLEGLKESYARDAKAARQKMEEIAERREAGEGTQLLRHKLGNAATLWGNVTKYGRTVADVAGLTAGAPLRYVMLGATFFARGASAAKEARLKNEEVIEKTRVHDMKRAADEAWEIYTKALAEAAKAGKERVSAKDLERAYERNLPKDLLARLSREPMPGVASAIVERIVTKDVAQSVQSIDRKLKQIKMNAALSKEEKERQEERFFTRYSRHLKDIDRMMSDYGTVDALAMGARYAETAGKAVVAATSIQTLMLSIERLPKVFSHILSTAEAWAESGAGGAQAEAVIPPIVDGAEAPSEPVRTPLPKGETALNEARKAQLAAPEVTLSPTSPVPEPLPPLRPDPEGILSPQKVAGDEGAFPTEQELLARYEPRFSKENIDLATVGKGKGVEHAFINQLKADPQKFGFGQDLEQYKDRADWTKAKTPEAMERGWARWKAHRIALETGLVQEGKELRVLDQGWLGKKNPAYVLEMEGGQAKVTVALEGKEGKLEIGPSFSAEQKWTGEPIKGYEYVYDPSARPARAETVPSRATPPAPRLDEQAEKPEVGTPGAEVLPVVDRFGNEFQPVKIEDTERVFFRGQLDMLPAGVGKPENTVFQAEMDSPEGPYRALAAFDVDPAKQEMKLIFRASPEQLGLTSRAAPEEMVRATVEATNTRLAFIESFGTQMGWERSEVVDVVNRLESGRAVVAPGTFENQELRFRIWQVRDSVLMRLEGRSSPFSGSPIDTLLGRRVEALTDFQEQAIALKRQNDAFRQLYDYVQRYGFEKGREWNELMEMQVSTVEREYHTWVADESYTAGADTRGGFMEWLTGEYDKLAKARIKVNKQMLAKRILDLIAQTRSRR